MATAEILHVSKTEAEVLFHGLSTDAFDRTNNLSLSSIVDMFLEGCLLPQNVSEFADQKALFRGTRNMLFTVHMSCNLTTQIHRISYYKKYKILVSSSVFRVGTTSYTLAVTLSNYLTSEKFGEFYIKFVYVNGNSRRPQPLPDWYVSCFTDIVQKQGQLPTLPSVPDMPEDAYSTTVLLRLSDLDTNQHVTTKQYFDFFNDCATEASSANYYTHFTADMCWYPVMSFDVTMLGESKAGEILTVRTWQDKKDSTQIFFACFKEGKCIMKAVFIYGLTQKELKLPPKL